MMKNNLTEKDFKFMNSLSAATLQTSPKKAKTVIWFWFVTVFLFLMWANFAEIDEIVRGNGDIIPRGDNQIVQNLEGGIIEKFYVKEGDYVKKGQLLLEIANQQSISSFGSNKSQLNALKAKIVRLTAESSNKGFNVNTDLQNEIPLYIKNEKSLYLINKNRLNSKVASLTEQLKQKKSELRENNTMRIDVKNSLILITKELKMIKPMVEKGIKSRIEFFQLQREANDIRTKYNSIKLSRPRIKASVIEVEKMILEVMLIAKSDAKNKLNESIAELKDLNYNSLTLKDEVERRLVKSPMNGTIHKLFFHTVGGVVRPGENIIELVPNDTNLLVEVKIKPSDIAFIYYGQKAIVKFSAYDFSIYGGLEGKVIHISADTITDEKENVFYTLRIKTNKSYLGNKNDPLKIIPGMTVSTDIITGKKSILDYILKPILKTKQYTFTER
ncbi:MAG: HlyD family type I secretion periplasmic adaptor subunit [Campylobacteraceae bacterium]|nr:HlyD family type I secretion periplasmic adaptor subunit [Campylobacteraceae bacterium]